MGDFVFYSLLVGKVATSQSAMCIIGVIVGILAGLIITLTVLSENDILSPALPLSLSLGLVIHFSMAYFGENFYKQFFHQPFSFIII
ncbi:unnamed protein product [Dracunculus medinensis]|uniref:ZIP family metal transporter n=1 Tax=Dracunculus medinensis TaxID=318479 RepID=A0A0N4UBS4_DRAME|nr:unnamed protein product [Dracunculus medinensis]